MTSMLLRSVHPLLMALTLSSVGLVHAQADGGTQSGARTPSATPKTDRTERAMFTRADKNKDGQLTRIEAKGALPLTHKNFASIDTDKRGWISYEQFAAFTNARVGKDAADIQKIGQRP